MYSFEKFDYFLFIDILAILDENCYSQLIFDPCYPGHLNGVNDILTGGGNRTFFWPGRLHSNTYVFIFLSLGLFCVLVMSSCEYLAFDMVTSASVMVISSLKINIFLFQIYNIYFVAKFGKKFSSSLMLLLFSRWLMPCCFEYTDPLALLKKFGVKVVF